MSSRPITRIRPRLLSLAVSGLLAASLLVTGSGGAAGASTPTAHQLLTALAQSPMAQGMSAQARLGMRYLTTHRWGFQKSGGGSGPNASRPPAARGVGAAIANTRVNDPTGDGGGDQDMTTQNETTVAASGSNIVVGYNDDGRSSFLYKAADDLTGYSFSNDGGTSWHDGELPNRYPGVNLGDPAVAVDRAGHFYFASLDLDPTSVILGVVVGRSDGGGQTFHRPKLVSTEDGFNRRSIAEADKEWITVAPDPANPANDVVYVTWTDFFDNRQGPGSRIMISASFDNGQTWSAPKAVVTQSERGPNRTFLFVQGSNVAGDANGKLYVAWEQEVDTTHHFTFNIRRELVARSPNSGAFFTHPVLAAKANQVGEQVDGICSQAETFGPSRYVRTNEFPVIGVGPGDDPFFTYSLTGADGNAKVRVAHSADGGQTWTTKVISSGKDAFMPSLGADSTGVTVTYYQREGRSKIRTMMAQSSDGVHYATSALSNKAFGVPFTFPGTDPFLAPCYMGDYLGTFRTGGVSYMAWGDNRDIVVNDFWPNGRIDPDVFFAQA